MDLSQSSLSDRAPDLGDRELHAAMRQLRASRDKYQDLLRRQRVESRRRSGSKSGPQGTDNARTERKLEALNRLEKQQQRRERARQREDGSGDPRRKAWREASQRKAARQPSDRPNRGSSRGDAPTAAKQAPAGIRKGKKLQDMGQQRRLAHVSSRGRRQQARRDSRS